MWSRAPGNRPTEVLGWFREPQRRALPAGSSVFSLCAPSKSCSRKSPSETDMKLRKGCILKKNRCPVAQVATGAASSAVNIPPRGQVPCMQYPSAGTVRFRGSCRAPSSVPPAQGVRAEEHQGKVGWRDWRSPWVILPTAGGGEATGQSGMESCPWPHGHLTHHGIQLLPQAPPRAPSPGPPQSPHIPTSPLTSFSLHSRRAAHGSFTPAPRGTGRAADVAWRPSGNPQWRADGRPVATSQQGPGWLGERQRYKTTADQGPVTQDPKRGLRMTAVYSTQVPRPEGLNSVQQGSGAPEPGAASLGLCPHFLAPWAMPTAAPGAEPAHCPGFLGSLPPEPAWGTLGSRHLPLMPGDQQSYELLEPKEAGLSSLPSSPRGG